MSKKYDEIKNLFDDVEQSSSENPVEDGTQQNEMSHLQVVVVMMV